MGAINANDKREELDALLIRRRKYFLLSFVKRKIYQVELEKVQAQIIFLKLALGIYQDDLDMLEAKFNYQTEAYKELVCMMAEKKREIKWIDKRFNPEDNQFTYVALVSAAKNHLTDPWLHDILDLHILKRDGYMNSPWPMVLDADARMIDFEN